MSLISSLKKKIKIFAAKIVSFLLFGQHRRKINFHKEPTFSFFPNNMESYSDYFYALINLTPPCKYLTNIQETNIQTLIVLNKYSGIDWIKLNP